MKLSTAEFVKSATKPAHYPPSDLPEIAFAGRSNVGKSSLLNTLLGRKALARVSRTPGRTQLINFFIVNDAFYCVDLPGYGYAKVPLAVRKQWGPMMERYVRSRSNLRAMIVLFDIRRTPNDDDMRLLDSLAMLDLAVIPVLTKCDKLSRNKRMKRRSVISEASGIPQDVLIEFSSHTGLGRGALLETVELALTEEGPREVEPGFGDEDDDEDEDAGAVDP